MIEPIILSVQVPTLIALAFDHDKILVKGSKVKKEEAEFQGTRVVLPYDESVSTSREYTISSCLQ
jgi:hypothetical protein